jgi:hypothetical protein
MLDRNRVQAYIRNMTNATRTTEYVGVRKIENGLVTFQDGYRIQFLSAVPSWIANRQALAIREALESGDWFIANFDAFRIVPAVEDFR